MDAKTLGEQPVSAWGEHGTVLGGITLREHYAGLAMQALLAQAYDNNGMRGYEGWREEMGREAVRFADALLIALTEEPTDGR